MKLQKTFLNLGFNNLIENPVEKPQWFVSSSNSGEYDTKQLKQHFESGQVGPRQRTANIADWLRTILNMFLLSPEPPCPNPHSVTKSLRRRLAEKDNPKYVFTIPRATLPKPSLCDKITATKSVTKSL